MSAGWIVVIIVVIAVFGASSISGDAPEFGYTSQSYGSSWFFNFFGFKELFDMMHGKGIWSIPILVVGLPVLIILNGFYLALQLFVTAVKLLFALIAAIGNLILNFDVKKFILILVIAMVVVAAIGNSN